MIPQRHTIHLWQGLALAAVMTILLPLDALAQPKSKIEVVPQIPHTSRGPSGVRSPVDGL